MNVSHIIHELSFGPKYPGIHNPLDGTSRIVQKGSGTFKYYIKVKFVYPIYAYLIVFNCNHVAFIFHKYMGMAIANLLSLYKLNVVALSFSTCISCLNLLSGYMLSE